MTAHDEQVEKVARAIYEAGIPKGGRDYVAWDDLDSEGYYAQHDLAMKQAAAAIAAMDYGLWQATHCFECETELHGPSCPKCSEGDGWQDIASAPRDGTRVLLSVGKKKPTATIARWSRRWDSEDDEDFDWVNDEGDGDIGSPTHWRPLPDPPAAEIGGLQTTCPTLHETFSAAASRIEALERAMADAVPSDAEPGGFIGDIFFGDASNSTRGTHRWNGATWEALPTDAEALTELLAKSRSRIQSLESRVGVLEGALEPFAAQQAEWSYRLPDTQGFGVMCISSPGDGDFHFDADITMGDFRRARRALAGDAP